MSTRRVIAIQCDRPYCGNRFVDSTAETKYTAQHAAALYGWHTTKRKDLCPDHLDGLELPQADLRPHMAALNETLAAEKAAEQGSDRCPFYTSPLSRCVRSADHDGRHIDFAGRTVTA